MRLTPLQISKRCIEVRKHRVKAFDEMSNGRFSESLRVFRKNGPSGAITIRLGEMISGRHFVRLNASEAGVETQVWVPR